MWKIPASLLCGWVIAVPLIGCAGDVASPQGAAVAQPVIAGPPYYVAGPRAFVTAPAGPAGILVVLPSLGAAPALADPRLLADEGVRLAMPRPADFYPVVENPNAALARLVASARVLADAPIWLLGAGQDINAVLAEPQSGRGAVSGVVVTSMTSNAGTCSESMYYSQPAMGAAPRVEVTRSGNCGANSSVFPQRQPPAVAVPPAVRPNAPRIIEASMTPQRPAAQVHGLAQLIKAVPPS